MKTLQYKKCSAYDCRWHGMWHSHPVMADRPNRPIPKVIPLSAPAIFTVREAVDYHKLCAKCNRNIINGSQWPKSLKEYCKQLEAGHLFYAWVLSIQ